MQTVGNQMMGSTGREVWLDYMRVMACFMVMVVHSTEPFYLGGEGALVLTATDAFWVAVFEGLVRCCVPLFVIASSYLQFPLHYSAGEFLRRRAVRILVPMALWTVVYALVWGEPVANLKGLLLNFNYAAGHLWFVYMLVGLYLLMPLLSPWAEKVSRKELEVYLGLWLLTTLFPLVREWAGGEAPLIQAADGLPAPALFPLWGEASWNPFGTFYYVSGFLGYLLVGLYVRKFLANNRWTGFLGWSLFLLGFVGMVSGLLQRISATADAAVASGVVTEPFPVNGPLGVAVAWETPIAFCGLPVVLCAVGLVLVFRRIDRPEGDSPDGALSFSSATEGSVRGVPSHACGGFYRHIVLPLSLAGYGMYLMHMLVLGPVSGGVRDWLGVGPDGVLGAWTTPVEILLTAFTSFAVVGLAAVLLRRIPRLGKWIIG